MQDHIITDENNISVSWKVISTSVSGSDHEKAGTPCQDANYHKILRNNILVSAIADGAGTALMGELGAKIAVQSAVKNVRIKSSEIDKLNDEKWKEILIRAFRSAQEAIEIEAEEKGMAVRDFATTLILVISYSGFVVAGQIGDGAVILADNENLTTLTKPQNAEYINETTFIVLPDALETIQIEFWHGTFTHIAIITDGLELLALKMPECIPHEPFFKPLFRFVSNVNEKEAQDQLATFLRSQRIRERTTDDLTLFLVALTQK
jgi:DNA polymerase III delta prime subunit